MSGWPPEVSRNVTHYVDLDSKSSSILKPKLGPIISKSKMGSWNFAFNTLSCVATRVSACVYCMRLQFLSNYFGLSQPILKTQLHAANPRWKRVSQSSFNNNNKGFVVGIQLQRLTRRTFEAIGSSVNDVTFAYDFTDTIDKLLIV